MEPKNSEEKAALSRISNELREGIFEQLFAVAEIAKFTKEETDAYEDSLKSYRDLKKLAGYRL